MTDHSFEGLRFPLCVVQFVIRAHPGKGRNKGDARRDWGAGAARQFGSLGFGVAVAEAWTVPLPPEAHEPFEVYVNGVLQRRGADYEVEGPNLRFTRSLAKEGRLGVLRWLSMFLGVAGTYRKNDSVDVVFEAGGRRRVASGLPIVPPERDE